MLRTLILAVSILAAPQTVATANASGCAAYIKVCARPDAASTGGGGDSPFYAPDRDRVTHQLNGTSSCRSGCDHVAAGDRTLGD